MTSLRRSQKQAILLGLDLLWMLVAFAAAQMLVLRPTPGMTELFGSLHYLALILPLGAALIQFFGLHRIKLNAYGMQGVIESALLAVIVAGVGFAGNYIPGRDVQLPVAAFVVLAMLFLILSVFGRLALRNLVRSIYRRGQERKRVLIYGAGQTGQQLAAALFTDQEVEPVAFVDDNPVLQKLIVSGLRVHPPAAIRDFVDRDNIDQVVLAMPSASQPVRIRIAHRLRDLGVEVMAVPSFAEMVARSQNEPDRPIKPVEMSRLLGRDGLEADLPAVSESYRGRRILVTGAGGSIGSELCRQLVACSPESLVVLDHSELALYNIQRELSELAPGVDLVPVLGSIVEPGLVAQTLTTNQVEVVLHAAAYKHLPLVEENCLEGLRNNVLGTKVVADAARAAGVERFILVSSDKAVRPTSVMGASKRLAELLIQDLATRSSGTLFSMVRFGNVLGSSGSVIPLFEDQIRRGGPVTVTHSDVTRYFMTVSEAVRLVLLAGSFARGGDVFVLDMGKPVVIGDLARQMIEAAGYSVRDDANPEGDIAIAITGLRPGEKMHEELLIGSDMLTTPHPKILRAQESRLSELETANAMLDLRKAIEARDEKTARQVLTKWIETDHGRVSRTTVTR